MKIIFYDKIKDKKNKKDKKIMNNIKYKENIRKI
jgi:hypothetical protein